MVDPPVTADQEIVASPLPAVTVPRVGAAGFVAVGVTPVEVVDHAPWPSALTAATRKR